MAGFEVIIYGRFWVIAEEVTNKDGLQGIVISPGDSTKVVSLASDEMREWPMSSYTVNANQDISSVFVVNQNAFTVSTIMWGVLLGNLLTGFVGAFLYLIPLVYAWLVAHP
jgi:hypothetical protein